MQRKIEIIKKQIDSIDSDQSTNFGMEVGSKSYGEDDFSERYQKSPHYGDVSRADNESIICCPCLKPLNTCWVAILRGIGYGNVK